MSEAEQIKILCLTKAAKDMEELFNIIGDLGYVGYKISMCKMKGYSYQQCANKLGISKALAQYHYEKCKEKLYDTALKRIFKLQ